MTSTGGGSRYQRTVAKQRAAVRRKMWGWILGGGLTFISSVLGFYLKHCIDGREQALQEIRAVAISSKTADDKFLQSAAAFYSQIDVLFLYVEANKPKTEVLAQYRNDLYSAAQRAGIDCEQSRGGHYSLTNALSVFEEKFETGNTHSWLSVNFSGNCAKWDDWQRRLRSWDFSRLEKEQQIRSESIKSWTKETVTLRENFEELNKTAALIHRKTREIIESEALVQASLPRSCLDCLKSLLPNSLRN